MLRTLSLMSFSAPSLTQLLSRAPARCLCLSVRRWFNEDDTRLAALAKSAQKDADKIAAAKAKADEGFVTVGKKKKR